MNERAKQVIANLKEPTIQSSYKKQDCVFVLNDVGNWINEENNEVRKEKRRRGKHDFEMLPKESYPSQKYLNWFYSALQQSAHTLAFYIALMAKTIWKEKGKDVVFVSFARRGTPIGILLKRYLQYRYEVDIPHYSISILQEKGIDENAVLYILHRHPSAFIQFIDGWTGKGSIAKELKSSIKQLKEKYDVDISDDLAVVSDPAHAASICGTREDFLLPSACLNATVSGLISKTFYWGDLAGMYGYHGAKYYKEWEKQDLSYYFIEMVERYFPYADSAPVGKRPVTFQGWNEIKDIQKRYRVNHIHNIKAGIGETTKSLLTKTPELILIKDIHHPQTEHVLWFAQKMNIPVETYPFMTYACIGIFREEERDAFS